MPPSPPMLYLTTLKDCAWLVRSEPVQAAMSVTAVVKKRRVILILGDGGREWDET